MIDLTPLLGSAAGTDSEQVEFRIFPKSGPPRWMLESRFRSPWHLKTWPRAGLRARAINRCAWCLSWLGLHLPHRTIQQPIAAGSTYQEIRERFDRIGVFLGTPGENRKIVIFAENDSESVFIKVPLGPASERLTARESEALTALSSDDELSELVPSVSRVAGHLAVENLERLGVRHGVLPLLEAVRFHRLLFERSRNSISVGELRDAWNHLPTQGVAVSGYEQAPHSPKVYELVQQTMAVANQFLDTFQADEAIDCYMAHGDFTPWNTLVARDGTARVIDWELYGRKPRYFDLIHYFVASDILVSHSGSRDILARLDAIAAEVVPDERDRQSWNKFVGLYFSHQSLYYGPLYSKQVDLHVQAIWQLDVWRDVLRDLLHRRQ